MLRAIRKHFALALRNIELSYNVIQSKPTPLLIKNDKSIFRNISLDNYHLIH